MSIFSKFKDAKKLFSKVREAKSIIDEAELLLLTTSSPSECTDRNQDGTPCGKRECRFCRTQKCIDDLIELSKTLNSILEE